MFHIVQWKWNYCFLWIWCGNFTCCVGFMILLFWHVEDVLLRVGSTVLLMQMCLCGARVCARASKWKMNTLNINLTSNCDYKTSICLINRFQHLLPFIVGFHCSICHSSLWSRWFLSSGTLLLCTYFSSRLKGMVGNFSCSWSSIAICFCKISSFLATDSKVISH